MRNRSSRSAEACRALVVVLALACLPSCSFFVNEFVPLDAAPTRAPAPVVVDEGP